MSAAQSLSATPAGEEPVRTTLLELICSLSESTRDDREVVATVLHLLRSGRVRLVGNFRGTSAEDLT